MSNPLVSFIIPYFNAGITIQETIDSIFNQSYLNFDIWIINDGSTDQFSIDKLKAFEGNDKIHILNTANNGPSIARNTAINLTNSKFIIPLDADDLILKNTIQQSLIELEKHREIGVVYGNLRFFGEEISTKNQDTFSIERQLLWNQVAVCCVIRKEVFDDVGMFDEELSQLGLEDWEFGIRVGVSNWKFKKINEIHFLIRVTQGSRTFKVANKNLIEIKNKVFLKHKDIWLSHYESIYYDRKMLLETPDYRIGNALMKPWRMLKKTLKKLI